MGKKLHARTRPPAQHATKRPASVATSDDDDEEKQERERDGRARAINNGTARRPESLAVLPRPRDQRRWSKSAGGRGRERTVVWRRCAALGPGRAVLVLSSPLLHGLAAVTLAACGSSLSAGPDTAFTPLDRPLPTPCPLCCCCCCFLPSMDHGEKRIGRQAGIGRTKDGRKE